MEDLISKTDVAAAMERARSKVGTQFFGSITAPGARVNMAAANDLFDHYTQANTFRAVMHTFRQICSAVKLNPSDYRNFYPKLKSRLTAWKAKSLWAKLDKRAGHPDYRNRPCADTRVMIIGAGPCGLRAAIECALLGAKVVLIEKRDSFTRNNVLHIWPSVIHDLKSLGAKLFYGKFCAGAIDHISIRQLQLMLLKVALLLGVELHEKVEYVGFVEPGGGAQNNGHLDMEAPMLSDVGWRARVEPADHIINNFECDVIIGADGKRNTLEGFRRKEFRGKLAIAITANFINRHSQREARVEEISGVAFIFNQKFFQDLKQERGIDLENIVYYKDDTHYFVMTAKKQSLLERGVILEDYNDTESLLSKENINHSCLMDYACDAADFSTNGKLPALDFALNHYGESDVAMFDFTSMFAAEYSTRAVRRRGRDLLLCLVGDSLLEPFWPIGSGCARGFLGCMDAAWCISQWSTATSRSSSRTTNKKSRLHILAERESIHCLLSQTTPENLSRNFADYSIDPSTRYPKCNVHKVKPHQVRSLYDCDDGGEAGDDTVMRQHVPGEDEDEDEESEAKRIRRTAAAAVVSDAELLAWVRQVLTPYRQQLRTPLQDLTSDCVRSGHAFAALITAFRPDLLDFSRALGDDHIHNNRIVFEVADKHLGIVPVMSPEEMAGEPDTLAVASYLSQFYDIFKFETPMTVMKEEDLLSAATHKPSPQQRLNLLDRLSKRMHVGHKKREKMYHGQSHIL